MSEIALVKGHGTGNDFVIVPDHDGALDLSPAQVRLLCDRHRGIGADGVLRAVRIAADDEASSLAASQPAAGSPGAAEAEWFMDYRNADGSTAEMCGNGIRVFAEYLRSAGLAGDRLHVLTRGGVRELSRAEGQWTVRMGTPSRLPFLPTVAVHGSSERPAPSALSVLEIPNPHVVVRVPDEAALAALDLSQAPAVRPPLPSGQNVEFVAVTGRRSIAMRVHERGVGETQSCGTGICAAAVAVADHATDVSTSTGGYDEAGEVWTVSVPGGVCTVRLEPGGEVLLTGPAVLVARMRVDAHWLATAQSEIGST